MQLARLEKARPAISGTRSKRQGQPRSQRRGIVEESRIDVVKIIKLAVAQNDFIGSCRINQIFSTFHRSYGPVPEGFMGIYARYRHDLPPPHSPNSSSGLCIGYAFICVYMGAVVI